MRHAYQLVNSSKVVLIHYIGDDHYAVLGTQHRPHNRTCSSVMKSLKEACKDGTAASVYRKHVSDVPPAAHLAVLQPRDTRQVKNIRLMLQTEQQLSHDGLALDLKDIVHSIRIHPDVVCVCGSKQLCDEFDRVLVLQSPGHQLLSYDTTFQLGDFYLSTLTIRHTLFEENPVIPVAFLLHERKHMSCHKEFFDVYCELIPALKTTCKPIVIDEEQAYINVISKCMPAAPLGIMLYKLQRDGCVGMGPRVTTWLCIVVI